MAIPSAKPAFLSHFACKPCTLRFRVERPTFIIRECCPACSKPRFAHSWSFTPRHLAANNLEGSIKTLAEDVAYAVYDQQAFFPELPKDEPFVNEVNANRYGAMLDALAKRAKQGGNHE